MKLGEFVDPKLNELGLIDLPETRLQIEQLSRRLDSICIESLHWDKSDFLCVFITGVLGGLADIIIGKSELIDRYEVSNNSFFRLGKQLKDNGWINLLIDNHFQGSKSSDPRIYSFGRDLLSIIQGVRLLFNGNETDGMHISEDGFELSPAPKNCAVLESVWKSVITLSSHLLDDFLKARSCHMHSTSLYANMNNDIQPRWIDAISNDTEVNLSTLSGQALSVSINEFIPWLYLKTIYRFEEITSSMWTEKLTKMKLLSSSISMLFNAGKVISTQNPLMLNFQQINGILSLALQSIVEESELSNKAIFKTHLQVRKNKLELLETLIITEQALIMTNEVSKYVTDGMLLLEERINTSRSTRESQLALCREKLDDYRKLTKN